PRPAVGPQGRVPAHLRRRGPPRRRAPGRRLTPGGHARSATALPRPVRRRLLRRGGVAPRPAGPAPAAAVPAPGPRGPPAAGRRQRRALPRPPAPAAARRADRHPARLRRRRPRRAPLPQRRTAPQRTPRDARTLRRRARGGGPHGRGGRPLHLLARRAALRLPRGTVPRQPDAAAVPDRADLGGGETPLRRPRPRQGPAPGRARADADRRAALRGLLPDRLGPDALRPGPRHPLPGAR